VADFFTIYAAVIWRDGWKIVTFTYWFHFYIFHFDTNFYCRVNFARNAN